MPTGTAMRLLKAARLWIEKMWYIYTTEYYSAIKKNEMVAIGSNMDATYYAIIVSEVCHFTFLTKRERYMLSLIYGI